MGEMLQDLSVFATAHQDSVSMIGGTGAIIIALAYARLIKSLGTADPRVAGLLLHAAQLRRWCMIWLVTVPGLCCSCGKNCAIVDRCGWSAEVNTERSSRGIDEDLQSCIETL
jgi:hypothetical protein